MTRIIHSHVSGNRGSHNSKAQQTKKCSGHILQTLKLLIFLESIKSSSCKRSLEHPTRTHHQRISGRRMNTHICFTDLPLTKKNNNKTEQNICSVQPELTITEKQKKKEDGHSFLSCSPISQNRQGMDTHSCPAAQSHKTDRGWTLIPVLQPNLTKQTGDGHSLLSYGPISQNR